MTPPLPQTESLGLDEGASRVDLLAREVLGENYFHFLIRRSQIAEAEREDVDGPDAEQRPRVQLRVDLTRSGSGEDITIEGEGVGVVDAFFDGVMKVYADEYPSLKTIEVYDFEVEAKFDDAKGRRSDAGAVARLLIRNSEEVVFTFTRESSSVTRSVVRVSLDALTFFINSERAFVQCHMALQDAKERRRSDLVQRYRTMMGTLVGATSYSEVIERLKREEKGS